MYKSRLDVALVKKGLAPTRSQAESMIKLGTIRVDGVVVSKPGAIVHQQQTITSSETERYVSRAGLKLASVAHLLQLDFTDTTVLDVGSSTGGFTDYALQHGARKVIAVDVGTEQLHPSLRGDKRIELYEKTDIRDFRTSEIINIVVIDVSFISLREILPAVQSLSQASTQIVAMLKPQFEAGRGQINKGIVKNDALRRTILKDFESWSKQYFVISHKADSHVRGSKGNQERFYLLRPLA